MHAQLIPYLTKELDYKVEIFRTLNKRVIKKLFIRIASSFVFVFLNFSQHELNKSLLKFQESKIKVFLNISTVK